MDLCLSLGGEGDVRRLLEESCVGVRSSIDRRASLFTRSRSVGVGCELVGAGGGGGCDIGVIGV